MLCGDEDDGERVRGGSCKHVAAGAKILSNACCSACCLGEGIVGAAVVSVATAVAGTAIYMSIVGEELLLQHAVRRRQT